MYIEYIDVFKKACLNKKLLCRKASFILVWNVACRVLNPLSWANVLSRTTSHRFERPIWPAFSWQTDRLKKVTDVGSNVEPLRVESSVSLQRHGRIRGVVVEWKRWFGDNRKGGDGADAAAWQMRDPMGQ